MPSNLHLTFLKKIFTDETQDKTYFAGLHNFK